MSSDIEFDRYGDMSFLGNDISTIGHRLDFVYQNVIDRLMTNFGDYYLYPNFGANTSSYIGKTNDAELEVKVTNAIRRALTHDEFILSDSLTIVSDRSGGAMFIKLLIGAAYLSLSEDIVINSIFNTSSGLLYVEN